MKKVSVIVPVYNGEKRLKRCVESILNQDYPALELILVDDGSRDGSWEQLSAYAEKNDRVKAIHKENGGVSSARNRGLAEASGTYVQFVDVDDWLPLDSTKLLVREMEQSGAELVVGDFYRVVNGNLSEKGAIEKGGVLTRQEYADRMLQGPADLYYGVLWNKLYRRDLLARYAVRMDESISYSEDMIFNLEYLRHVETVAVLKAPVYYYQYTKGSLVDQSRNLSSNVKMKTSVIGHYDRFFKDTFDKTAYQERLPMIYSFLVAVSRDSLALPFLPGTRKLGEDGNLSALSRAAQEHIPMQNAALSVRLTVRYLETLAKKHGLERNELLILYHMDKLLEPCTLETLIPLTGLERSAVNTGLSHLLAKGYVTYAGPTEHGDCYCFRAPQLREDLGQLDRDFDAVRFEDFTDEEIRLYRELEGRASANILRRLQGENAYTE